MGTFFYKERKRMQRSERSFTKNRKERKDQNVLYKERKRMQRSERSFERTDAQPWLEQSNLPNLEILPIPKYKKCVCSV